MGKMVRGAILAGLAVCFVSCGTNIGLAQNTNSGDIRGTVTDPSGAVIPGVTVTVQDITKNVTHTYTTDGAGLYDTGSIVPDAYILTFTKDGFSTYERGPITLLVGTSTVNATLKVGAIQQKIVVNTNITLLKTETGAQSTTLTAKSMAQLPQVGADWQNFVILMPGTSGTPQNASNSLNPGQVASVNGNLPYSTVLADGATTTLPMSQNSDVSTFETVSEVKISTSAFSAQYGIGGVIYNQITKGGGNSFHGAAYEYFQNNALNAAPYSFGQNAAVPVLHYNDFGGSISGPIIKRKMFFYFNYDKTIDIGGANNGFDTVPTAAMLNGDFSGMTYTAPDGSTQPLLIYDPTKQYIDASGVVHRESFEEEYHNGNKIPASMIDPVAKAIQAYWPKPNTPGTVVNGITTNNYFYNTPSSNPFIKYFGRLDYDVSPSNRLTISEISSDNPATYLNEGTCPIDCQHGDVSRDNAQISDVWTISPRVLNEARFGFTDQLNFFTPFSINQGFPAKLGWKFAKADIFPTINITGACCYYFQPSSNAVYKEFVFDPSDVVTMIRGRHVLHFGGEFLISRADSTAWGNINGGYMEYDGGYTSATGIPSLTNPSAGIPYQSGLPYADFLLGQTEGWSAGVTPEFGARIKSPQLFVQDDIKVRPNLTLNIGLRWQGMTGFSEVKGNEASFDPTVMNPATNTLGAMWYGFSHANGRTHLQAPIWSTFLPRFGFSYQPAFDSAMVIRGGVGLYGYTWSEDTYASGSMGAAFGSSGSSTDTTNGLCPVVQLSSDGSTPDMTDPGCGVGNYNPNSINSLYVTSPTTPDAFNGQGVNYTQYHTPVPKIWQYNLEIQHEIGANMVANLAYVGSHAYGLSFPVDINQVPEDKLGPNDIQYRPYPQYQGISGSTNNASSNYSSLQASIQKRMTSGLEFNFNYTWSRFMDDQDSSGWGSREGNQQYQNSYVPSANYGPSNFDIRNMLKGQVVYELPFGKGRQFANNNRALDLIIGGWQTSATVIVQGGNPFTVSMQNDSSYSQAGNGFQQYPNVVGNPLSGPRNNNEWFNVAAYAQPAPGTFGDSTRNSLYGPGLTNVNFSLGKNFNLAEIANHSIVMQIRADATNVLNHPSFGQPDTTIGPGHTAQITSVTVGGRTMQLYGRISF